MNKDRDAQAEKFLGLLKPIERELEAYCRRMIWRNEDAPDALQNAVLRAFRAFDRYREDASFRAWMYKILTNEIFALNRKHGRIAQFETRADAEQLDGLGAAESAAGGGDWSRLTDSWTEALDQNLVESLKSLTEAERAVLLLRAIGEFRYHEIAETLGIPMGSVMGNLSRARQKMRAAIARTKRRTT